MLKRIYVDNFRSLVNFELILNELSLFIGPNGSGKTTLFDLLRKIQRLIGHGESVRELFPHTDLTRWQTRQQQIVELEMAVKDGRYRYKLVIHHDKNQQRSRLASETLSFEERQLAHFNLEDDATLYQDNGAKRAKYPVDGERSIIAFVPARDEYGLLTQFKDQLNRFIIVQPNPMMMTAVSDEETAYLTPNMSNFVSWYRYISQDQGHVFKITKALQEIWPQFEFFRFKELGEQHRLLQLTFSGEKKEQQFRFDELSEGERALIALYTLLHTSTGGDYTICIDEPENFVALPEIQPWLIALYDKCSEGNLQALLISHHPEFINYLAAGNGYWFRDRENGPARVNRIVSNGESGLPISELVARGWLNE